MVYLCKCWIFHMESISGNAMQCCVVQYDLQIPMIQQSTLRKDKGSPMLHTSTGSGADPSFYFYAGCPCDELPSCQSMPFCSPVKSRHAIDCQTDTTHHLIMPLPYGGLEHNNLIATVGNAVHSVHIVRKHPTNVHTYYAVGILRQSLQRQQ